MAYHRKRRGSLVLIVAAVVCIGMGATKAAQAGQTYDRYRRIQVTVGGVNYAVDMVTIDLANPRLKVLTLTGTNGSNCYERTCPVRSLLSYIKEVKGFAGINGTYFCPKDYATCGPTGNYYWMVFNARNRAFVNQRQNRFNTGALFTMDANRFWNFYPDTKTFSPVTTLSDVDLAKLTAAISNGPTLVNRGVSMLNPKLLDKKQVTAKGNRSGLGFKGSKLYLVVAKKATVPDLGKIMLALKMDYAMNLDGGGSSALWYRGSYKVGPGRSLPNALVFSER